MAIAACAEPRLRVALEKASAGELDEAAIDEAERALYERRAEA